LVTRRRGASALGCLLTLAVIAIVIYFGADVAGAYWRAYQYQDAMRQQMQFAARSPNETIIGHLRATADTLDLPDEARKIAVHRTPGSVKIEASYAVHVVFPLFAHDFRFHPHAEGTP